MHAMDIARLNQLNQEIEKQPGCSLKLGRIEVDENLLPLMAEGLDLLSFIEAVRENVEPSVDEVWQLPCATHQILVHVSLDPSSRITHLKAAETTEPECDSEGYYMGRFYG